MRDSLIRPLRYAVRRMARAPGFSAAMVLTLALGIGATTAMFAVLYGVLFRPLPYRDADRLAVIRLERTVEGAQRPVRSFFSLADLPELQSNSRAFDSVAMYAAEELTLSHNGFAERVHAARVSPGFFPTIGGRLRDGRSLSADDRGAVVISDRLARRLFGDENPVGRGVRLGPNPYDIVGVADRTFQIPTSTTDVWMIAAGEPCCPYTAIARLRVGDAVSRAAADVNHLLPTLTARSPRAYGGTRATVVPVRSDLVGETSRGLWVLQAGVLLMLAASCANAMNLLVARNTARWRERAIRMALGASPGRLSAESLAEAAVIVSAAGAAGWLMAAAAVHGLLRFYAAGLPGIDPAAVRLDLPAFLFALGAAAATTIVVGLVPTLARQRTAGSMQIDALGAGAAPRHRPLFAALAVVQLAVSVMLIVVAGLLGRSFIRLVTTDLGVRSDHVATAAINLAYERTLTDAQQAGLTDAIITRLQRLPDVQAVGAGAALPPHASTIRLTLKRFGDVVDYQAAGVPATPGYFSALGVRLIDGRLFTDADGDAQPPVMIMTVDTARRLFGSDNPVGRTLTLPVLRDGTMGSEEVTLVGVVSNVKYSGLQAAPDDAVYRPLRQQAWPVLFVVARTAHDPRELMPALRREIAAVDPGVAVSSVTTLDAIVAGEAAEPRFRSALIGGLAMFTVGIASIGLCGVVSEGVARRTREFGVRMALGADRASVFGLVFRDAAVVTGAGLLLGLGGALATAGALRQLLYGIEPFDPISFGGASALLVLVAAIATYLPARRASRLDPVEALRVG